MTIAINDFLNIRRNTIIHCNRFVLDILCTIRINEAIVIKSFFHALIYSLFKILFNEFLLQSIIVSTCNLMCCQKMFWIFIVMMISLEHFIFIKRLMMTMTKLHSLDIIKIQENMS